MNNHGPHEAPGLHVKERLWWLVWNLTFHWPSRVIGQTMSVPPPCCALLLDLFESLIWLVDWILDSSCRHNWRPLSELGSSWDGMATLARSIPPLPGFARMSEIVISLSKAHSICKNLKEKETFRSPASTTVHTISLSSHDSEQTQLPKFTSKSIYRNSSTNGTLERPNWEQKCTHCQWKLPSQSMQA
jgi:hypothetical protein